MRRVTVLLVVLTLLFAPVLGSANPNGVGSGTFDAQCGGACHGDADMNRSSTSTVVVEAPGVAYEGLLTSVAVTVSDIETTTMDHPASAGVSSAPVRLDKRKKPSRPEVVVSISDTVTATLVSRPS